MKFFKYCQIYFFVFTLLNIPQVLAQFNQYKSKTKFNGSKDTPQQVPQVVSPKNNDNEEHDEKLKELADDSDLDVFGREEKNGETNGTAATNTPEGKKFVNLNFETAFGPEVVTNFEFQDVELIELTKHMQKLTGINLILDKNIKGKISIVAPTAITVGDAWKAYLTALNLNGYSLIPSGAFYKIVNARDLRYMNSKIYTGSYTPDTENYVMRIIPLKNISEAEITRNFRPFQSRYGRIIGIKQTNTIIIHDTGENINRLVKLIKYLDVPGHEESLQIMKVKYSSAQEIAKLLDQILKTNQTRIRTGLPGEQGQNISKIIAETRTNSIIAMANAEGAKQLKELITKLDVKLVARGSGQIHVYYLNYGDSETLAKTLSSLVSSAQPASGASRLSGAAAAASPLFNAEVKITSDKANNALVITSSPTDFLTLKNVISKLDVARDQVYVEGMIMETNISKGSAFGVSIMGGYGSGAAQKAGFLGGSSELVDLVTNNITNLGGLFVGGGFGKKVDLTMGSNKVQVNNISGLITAIATNSSTNVLSSPQILALDNEEAAFEVGESVPVPKQTTTNGTVSTSIEEQNATLSLKLTPQINKVTRFIKLKIDQKIDEFKQEKTTSGEGLGKTKRSAVTTVVVRDRDTIAMGGMMRDKVTDSVNKVPLLGDIPVLGWLFKRKGYSVQKVNLLFFLTPKILDTYQDTVASSVKDLLNRRSVHLKSVHGEQDPFAGTVKDLYDKAKKQQDGPLFDESISHKYKNSELDPNDEFGAEEDEGTVEEKKPEATNTVPMEDPNTPNYKEIMEKVKENQNNKEETPAEIKEG